ncbi:hypothetical protein ABNG03_10150 [Halorubrum sp. RMP-47]|uniref:DUF7344 domain-containing protein n=1 Tax=Halorubrum miltondacostae TaxID=3076378 RepID=A0ABD5LYB8_9EURY
MEQIPSAAEQYTDQSLSTIHHTLRASRRRLIVGLVAHRSLKSAEFQQTKNQVQASDSEPTVTVRQISREIVSIEEGIPLEHATGDPYHNVYTALIQTHLPELDDVGAIRYNPDRKNIRPDDNLFALSMVAALTSPVAQMLFHSAIADINDDGVPPLGDSTGD